MIKIENAEEKMAKRHDSACYEWNENCPCLTCSHDSQTGNPNSATKCCDLCGHSRDCEDAIRCPDYEEETDAD